MMIHDSHDDERLDLRAIDPDFGARLASGEERFVGAVMERIARSAKGPAAPTDPLYGLWSLPQPLLIAASLLLLATAGIALRSNRPRGEAPATVADATGVPPIFLATGASRP